jgi:hypothetical protein
MADISSWHNALGLINQLDLILDFSSSDAPV